MLTLMTWPTSPFGAKVKACIKALNKDATSDHFLNIHIQSYHPWQRDDQLRQINPLNKIPVLILENGEALYDSPVICMYLNERAHGTLIPKEDINEKYKILRLEALSDGILDAAVCVRYETHFRPKSLQSIDWQDRQMSAVIYGLSIIAKDSFLYEGIHLGSISVSVTLAYIFLRYPEIFERHVPPLLKQWHKDFLSYHPWIQETLPDDTMALPDQLIALNK